MASPDHGTAMLARRRNARAAVATVFFLNGALYANLVVRYPEIQAGLGLSNAAFGAALAALPFGALVAGLFAPLAIGRAGSARVASLGLVALALVVPVAALAPSALAIAAVLLLIGGLDSVIDVAQNAHGLRVQRLYGRSIVNAFHGLWSVGAVTGGLMGASAAGLGIPLGAHLSGASAVFVVMAVIARRFLLTGPEDAEREAVVDPGAAPVSPSTVTASPSTATVADPGGAPAPGRPPRFRRLRGRPVRLLAAFGLLAACGALVEDAGASWGAIYLATERGATVAVAGLAFVALQSAMTVGRLLGDRVVDRFGQRAVVRAGGALAVVGMGTALALPSIPTTLLGFGLAGLGTAILVPAAMHAADELPGLPPGLGLAVVSWLLRVGFLVSPPVIGLIADATSLRVALLSVVLSGLVVMALSRLLSGRTGDAPATEAS